MTTPQVIGATLPLSNSIKIPQLGFGVYKFPPDLCIKSCLKALECGYRHIDTAQFYENEKEVGQAVEQSRLPREDIFITTKIMQPQGSANKTYQKCVESILKLDSNEGYVDLFLVHSPSSGPEGRKELWQVLERLYEEGKAKSIGVSNFGIKHIEGLKSFAKIWPPHVNQIELHPWSQQTEIVKYCEQNNIVVEAYCPLVRNQKAESETLNKIAKKHQTTPNQVLIRYCLERGWVPLPKSDNPSRIKSNADVYGFSLDKEDMNILNGLNQGAQGAIVEAVNNEME